MEMKLLYIELSCILAVYIDWYLTVVSQTPCLMLIIACYRLTPDNGNCTNCMLHLLHGIWQSILSVGISFLLVSAEFFANLSLYPCPHISWFCGLENLPSFANYSCILVLTYDIIFNSDPYSCRCDQKNVLFARAKLVRKYLLLCSIRFPHLCNKNAQNWSLN